MAKHYHNTTNVKGEKKVDTNEFVGWALYYEEMFKPLLRYVNFSWKNDFPQFLEVAKSQGFVYKGRFKTKGNFVDDRTVAVLEKEMPFGKIGCIVAHDPIVRCYILLEKPKGPGGGEEG